VSAPRSPRRRVLFAGTGLVVASVVTFGALAPPERCPRPTVESLDSAAVAAVQWFVDNQRPDGTWLYQYDRATDTEVTSEPYNLVRHAGGIMGLYQAATAGIPGALESADRGVEWARYRLVDHDGWTALADGGTAPVGGAALLAAGLVERRSLTGDTRDDDLMRALGRFMVAMTLPDGAVISHYDLTTMAPITDSRSKYYTGEAYWALARLHRLFPDDGFGEVADRIGNYLATRRDDEEGHWPPVPDHWAAYALAETVQFPERDRRHPLTDAELDYARSQAGSFGAQVRWVSQQAGPWGVAVRGTHVPRGGGYGVVGEALTGFWRVAEADERLADLRQPLADRAECIAGLAIDRQERDGPVGVDGAWFTGDVTRMDDQQHATSALLRTTAIVDSTPSTGHTAPSAWLWAVTLLALLDPLAIGMAVPRRLRRSDRATLAAAGTAIGAVIVVAAALLGDPLFDALGVSRPAGRLAVGLVAAVTAIARLFQPAPRPQDGVAGWRAALVPVAIPLTASPALVLLGLSAGADIDARFVAGVLAIGVGLATAATFVPDAGGGRTAAAWGRRLVVAIGLAACILLVIDAVFDV
jgi:small neutral amino acid transporter SnatA (MarC family)